MPAIVDLAAMRHAMRPRRRRGEDESAAPGRARDRPLRPGGRLREPHGDARQHRPRVRAEPRALRLPPLGPAGVRRPQGRPPGDRDRPPGQPRVPGTGRRGARRQAFPDTLLGTDSHDDDQRARRPRRGVGGIEAEAAMLGESVSMLVPQVGFRLTGSMREGATATDLVLTVTQILRQTGVVGKFVEYFGAGVSNPARRPGDDREHVAGVRRDLRFLPRRPGHARVPAADRTSRRSESRSSRLARRIFSGTTPSTSRPTRRSVELDLGDVEPSLAGPRAAGPRAADGARSARSWPRSRASASTTERARRGGRRVVPRERPRGRGQHARPRPVVLPSRAPCGRRCRAREARTGRTPTASSSTSSTEPS